MNKMSEERDALSEKLALALQQSEKTQKDRQAVEDAFLAMEKMETEENKEYHRSYNFTLNDSSIFSCL